MFQSRSSNYYIGKALNRRAKKRRFVKRFLSKNPSISKKQARAYAKSYFRKRR